MQPKMIYLNKILLNGTNILFNQILFDLTIDLSLFIKMIWLDQVHFFGCIISKKLTLYYGLEYFEVSGKNKLCTKKYN